MSEITKRHEDNAPRNRPVKVGYLVTGLVFVGLACSWALHASGTVDGITVGWLLPGILVGAGVIGLLAMFASGVHRGRPGPATAEPLGTDPEEVDR
jgi:F0F1-type ATP synthase membrane subunit c/vacuolar-type H+-ATPase subunit K